MNIYDTIIIGGGPAGLCAAIYLLRANKNVLLFESETLGGAITKSDIVENYPGISEISGLELGSNMASQAKNLGLEIIMQKVLAITKEKDIFSVSVNNNKYYAKTIVYATGTRPRMLDCKGAVSFIGKGVSTCATCDGFFFKNKSVLVVGGGNTALTDALYLSNICSHVCISYRRDNLRGEPLKIKRLKSKENVTILYNSIVKEIIGTDVIEKVSLTVDDTQKEINVSGVFVAIGSIPNTELIKDLVTLDQNGYALSNYQLETTVPGLYVAGDVREKNVRQLTTAVSDGTIVSKEILDYLES